MYHCALFLLITLIATSAIAQPANDKPISEIPEEEKPAEEKYNSGWRINIDNDLLTGQTTDRDYTGGMSFTLSGRRVQEYPISIDSWRAAIDNLFHLPAIYNHHDHKTFHAQQYGMTLFTPADISSTSPVYTDRPYASLFYLSNTEFTVLAQQDTAYVSILTIGFLGLELAESVQQVLHGLTDSEVPNGWQHQISAGGEPTAMLTYGVQKNIFNSSSQQLKAEYEANLGYITDINAGFSWRWGQINSPWWTFNPYQSKYMQQAMPVFLNTSNKNEIYAWAGARLNLRLYNALLQGQFRHSEVTIVNDQLQHLVVEYWLGLSADIAKQYSASLFLRGHSDEFKGQNARGAAWVGLVFSRAY